MLGSDLVRILLIVVATLTATKATAQALFDGDWMEGGLSVLHRIGHREWRLTVGTKAPNPG